MPGKRRGHPRLRDPRGREHPFYRRGVALVHPVRAGPPRAGGVVHGRDIRPANRAGGRLLGDARPGGDQSAARHRGRHDQQHAAGGRIRAGGTRPQLQGVASGRRPSLDVRPGEQVGGTRAAGRGRPGNGPQGVQARADRAARRGLPGRSRRRRGTAGRTGTEAAGRQRPAARRPVRGTDHPGRGGARRGAAPRRPRRPRRRPLRRRHRVAPLRRETRAARRDHLPRQGRLPGRPPAGAGGRRLHATRLRQLRFRRRGRDRQRRLRAAGVRPRALQSRRRQADRAPESLAGRGGHPLQRDRGRAGRPVEHPGRAGRHHLGPVHAGCRRRATSAGCWPPN